MNEIMGPEFDVIGCGVLNTDYVYRVDRIIRGGLGTLENVRISSGGSAANTIYGLAKLGLKTGFIGALGDDGRGAVMKSDLDNVGVDIRHVSIKTMTQSGSVVRIADGKNKTMYVSPGANDLLSRGDVESGFACRARFLHLSSFVGRKQLALQLDLAECPTSGPRVTLSPNMLYARLGLGTLAPLLRRTHVMFINREQLQALTGEDLEAGARICHAHGVQVVVVVMRGAIHRENGVATVYVLSDAGANYIMTGPLRIPPFSGLGLVDSFAAGFLFGLVAGRPLEACALLGDAVARISLVGIGARDGLPSLAELKRRFPKLAR